MVVGLRFRADGTDPSREELPGDDGGIGAAKTAGAVATIAWTKAEPRRKMPPKTDAARRPLLGREGRAGASQ